MSMYCRIIPLYSASRLGAPGRAATALTIWLTRSLRVHEQPMDIPLPAWLHLLNKTQGIYVKLAK